MLPPDVGCFRANALMASNQAVDSSKVTALPGRGRQPQPRPGGPAHSLPPPRPCRTCYPGRKEVSSPAPAAPAMGIDTGPSAYSCSRTPAFGGPAKPPRLQPGLTVWVPGKGSAGHPSEKAGTRGHRGAQSQRDPIPITHKSHARLWLRPPRSIRHPSGIRKDPLHLPAPVHDPGPCCGA